MCVRPPKVCVLPDLMQKIFLTWMAPMNMVPCLLLNSVFFLIIFFNTFAAFIAQLSVRPDCFKQFMLLSGMSTLC